MSGLWSRQSLLMERSQNRVHGFLHARIVLRVDKMETRRGDFERLWGHGDELGKERISRVVNPDCFGNDNGDGSVDRLLGRMEGCYKLRSRAARR